MLPGIGLRVRAPGRPHQTSPDRFPVSARGPAAAGEPVRLLHVTAAMNILSWILLGLLAGGTAKLIFPGKDPGGCLVTIGIGILGALLGGFIGSTLFAWGPITGFDLRSLGIAVAGSLVLLALFRLLARPAGDGTRRRFRR